MYVVGANKTVLRDVRLYSQYDNAGLCCCYNRTCDACLTTATRRTRWIAAQLAVDKGRVQVDGAVSEQAITSDSATACMLSSKGRHLLQASARRHACAAFSGCTGAHRASARPCMKHIIC
jgi:hypothetical protein